MIILKDRQYWTAFALLVAVLLVFGVASWALLMHAAGQGAGDFAALKFTAERLLFYALIAAGVSAAVGVSLYSRARRQRRSAEQLMAGKTWMDDGGLSLESRLGEIGKSFYRINRELILTNSQRGIKIQGLNALAAFLVKNFDQPIFVLNAAGEIAYVSADYLEQADAVRSEILGQPLNALLSDLHFPEIISEFGRTPHMISRSSQGKTYGFYNIIDRRGEIAYVLVSSGSGRAFHFAVREPDRDDGKGAARRRFSWIFSPRSKR